jgi:hypothetical protein
VCGGSSQVLLQSRQGIASEFVLKKDDPEVAQMGLCWEKRKKKETAKSLMEEMKLQKRMMDHHCGSGSRILGKSTLRWN